MHALRPPQIAADSGAAVINIRTGTTAPHPPGHATGRPPARPGGMVLVSTWNHDP
ncbi:hypothetical protein GCM10010277_68920 [Streptomyces longisporoflavus]|nr:hypothetical protein GCM10010277_68920 [Streptomyces longisporoflavus]